MLWYCRLDIGKSIKPVTNWVMRFCLQGGAMICTWSSWCHCHCHPIISCFIKIHNGFTFLVQLTQVVLTNRPLNSCLSICLSVCLVVFHSNYVSTSYFLSVVWKRNKVRNQLVDNSREAINQNKWINSNRLTKIWHNLIWIHFAIPTTTILMVIFQVNLD